MKFQKSDVIMIRFVTYAGAVRRYLCVVTNAWVNHDKYLVKVIHGIAVGAEVGVYEHEMTPFKLWHKRRYRFSDKFLQEIMDP